jgi:hypothetical protein
MVHPVLILDTGHAGKPGRSDVGAVWGDRTEVAVVRQYVTAARLRAAERGLDVLSPSLPAHYNDRQREAVRLAAAAPDRQFRYVACHFNAGSPTATYGLVGYDAASTLGRQFAEELAGALADACPWLSDVRAVAVAWNDAEAWKMNVHATIAGIYRGGPNITGVCFEPGFIAHDAATTHDALSIVGQVLADVVSGNRQAVGGDTPPEGRAA